MFYIDVSCALRFTFIQRRVFFGKEENGATLKRLYLATTRGGLVVPYRSTELMAMASGFPLRLMVVAVAGSTLMVNQRLP